MKQELWIINSSLLGIFLVTLVIGSFLQQQAPRFRLKKHTLEERKKIKELTPEEIKNIYKYDLFGTFVSKTFAPSRQQLVPPMPQPKKVTLPKPPEIPKHEFIPALTLTLKGIAFSSDEEKSVSIIEDENKQESIYKTGDMIKDAQLIKISQNRITLLRVNGQHETIYLRDEDIQKPQDETEKKSWDHIAKKINETTYELDGKNFAKEIPDLGTLCEKLSLVTVYTKGKPTGTRIATVAENSIGSSIGLQKNDTITAINNLSATDKKERMKIYDTLVSMPIGQSVKIELQRNKQPVSLTYKLTELKKIPKRVFTPKKVEGTEEKKTEEKKPNLPLSKLQKRAQKRRNFAKKHQGPQNNVINAIRKRLLENMRARVKNARIR